MAEERKQFVDYNKSPNSGGFNKQKGGSFKPRFGGKPQTFKPKLPYKSQQKPSLFQTLFKKPEPLKLKDITEPDFVTNIEDVKANGLRPKSLAQDPNEFQQQLTFDAFKDSEYAMTKAKAKLYRFLRDAIPDISAGVWAWCKICDTKKKIIIKGGTLQQQQEALQIINALDERIYEHDFIKASGFDLLSSKNFNDMFTVGASCGELWIATGAQQINKFLSIPPETVRFKRKDRVTMEPYQYWPDSNALVKLHPATFVYMPMSLDSNSIYGQSILTAIPFVTLLQNNLMRDMSAAMHNAGYVKYVFSMTPPAKMPSESSDQYKARVGSQFNQFSEAMKNLNPEDNIAVYDNIKVEALAPKGGGGGIVWYDSYKSIEEQVISGLKLAPFMIGRNYDTTGEFGTAQYDLILRNAQSVQKINANFLSWMMNLELAMKGSPCRAFVEHDTKRTVGALLEAQSELMRVKAAVVKRNEGILNQKQAAEELGYDNFDFDGPNPKYMSSATSMMSIPDTMPTKAQAGHPLSIENLSEREVAALKESDLLHLAYKSRNTKLVTDALAYKRELATKSRRDIEDSHDIVFT
jgi:hypothetical protein